MGRVLAVAGGRPHATGTSVMRWRKIISLSCLNFFFPVVLWRKIISFSFLNSFFLQTIAATAVVSGVCATVAGSRIKTKIIQLHIVVLFVHIVYNQTQINHKSQITNHNHYHYHISIIINTKTSSRNNKHMCSLCIILFDHSFFLCILLAMRDSHQHMIMSSSSTTIQNTSTSLLTAREARSKGPATGRIDS
jgi:putative Ca2+/H+ antiporter (TMEM165/GDT1 family)